MTREWTRNPDPQLVRAATNAGLDATAIRELGMPRGWMTDDLLHFAVTVAGGAHGDLHNGVLWLRPSVVSLAQRDDDTAFDASLGVIFEDARHFDDPTVDLPQRANILLFPLNSGNMHWSLLIFDHREPDAVRHYDSIPGHNAEVARGFVRTLLNHGYFSKMLPVVTTRAIVPQEDGYACGFYVTQYARRIRAAGQMLRDAEVGAVTSATSDALRIELLDELEPLFVAPGDPLETDPAPPSPAGKKPPKKPRAKARPRRSNKKIRKAVLLAVSNDGPFTDRFLDAHPRSSGKHSQEEAQEIVAEAQALKGIIGPSTETRQHYAKRTVPFGQKSSPKRAHLPPPAKGFVERRHDTMSEGVTPEGFQPTFFQFQRFDMDLLLAHSQDTATDPDDDHHHVARALLLGHAMANFYLEHGQPRFEPGDTRPEDTRDRHVLEQLDAHDGRSPADLALENMPIPADVRVDIAGISYGIAMHDASDGETEPRARDRQSAIEAFFYMRSLQYGIPYSSYIAQMIAHRDRRPPPEPATPVRELPVSKTGLRLTLRGKKGKSHNVVRRDDPPAPLRPRNINEQIVHDADLLDGHRLDAGHADAFDADRLLFLTDGRIDRATLGDSAQNLRAQLVADAAMLVELCCGPPRAATADRPAGPGREHFERVTSEYREATGAFGGCLEAYESFLIESIVSQPGSFSFLRRYYFHDCFDPAAEQFLLLDPSERLALVRTRIHSIERQPRDRAISTAALAAYNAEHGTKYTVDQLAGVLRRSELTINLRPFDLDAVIDGTVDGAPNRLQQMWELFWKTNKNREGGGASTVAGSRDDAEMRKLQYRVPRESPRFLRWARPKYAAINVARVPGGACPKYGRMAYVLRPHVWERATMTHNDTFNAHVLPDDACTLENPHALLRNYDGNHLGGGNCMELFAAGLGEARGKDIKESAQNGSWIRYLEAQIHGPIRWREDVEEIRIEVTTTTPPPEEDDGEENAAAPEVDAEHDLEIEAPKRRRLFFLPRLGRKKETLDLDALQPIDVADRVDLRAFDDKVRAFAAQWTSRQRPRGIPVRFVHANSMKVFSTRREAMRSQEPGFIAVAMKTASDIAAKAFGFAYSLVYGSDADAVQDAAE